MKHLKAITILSLVILFSSTLFGCAAIHSDELASTLAEDLEIEATIYEFSDDDDAEVSAQMQTEASGVGIEFTQGETLTVNSDAEDGLSPTVYLSNIELFNLNQDYEGSATKTIEDGNYYITYTDDVGNETTATIPTFMVPEINNIENGDIVSGTEVTVEWGVEELSGQLAIAMNYSGSGYYGYRRRNVSNTGSYDYDISNCVGSGSISLIHTMSFSYMEGFGSANITMNNASRRYVSFSNTQSSLVKALTTEVPLSTDELVLQCQTVCEEGEEDYIVVDDVTYDCCM